MKKLKLLLILALVIGSSCKKEMTFREWYSCEDEYSNRVEKATEDLNAKLISTKKYNELCAEYKKLHDKCVYEAENNK